MTDPISDEKLLPCPFCGDPMELHFDVLRHKVQDNCVIGAMAWPDSRLGDWNRRQSPSVIHLSDSDRRLLRMVAPSIDERSREPGDAWNEAAAILWLLVDTAAPVASPASHKPASGDTQAPSLSTGETQEPVGWEGMRQQIAALREGHRRKMNAAGGRAEMAAAEGDMAEVSINSTESERHREAFVALNVAIDIIDTTDPVLATASPTKAVTITDEMVERASRAFAAIAFEAAFEADAESEWHRIASPMRAALTAALSSEAHNG